MLTHPAEQLPQRDSALKRILDFWRDNIAVVEDANIELEIAQVLIDGTREALQAQGAPDVYIRMVFEMLYYFLPHITGGHPVCRCFFPLLEIEMEAPCKL